MRVRDCWKSPTTLSIAPSASCLRIISLSRSPSASYRLLYSRTKSWCKLFSFRRICLVALFIWSIRISLAVALLSTKPSIALINSAIVAIFKSISELYKFEEFFCTGKFFYDEMVLIRHRNFSTYSLDSTNCLSKLPYITGHSTPMYRRPVQITDRQITD